MGLFGGGKIKGEERDEVLKYLDIMDEIKKIVNAEAKSYDDVMSKSAQDISGNASEYDIIKYFKIIAEAAERLKLTTDATLRRFNDIEYIPAKTKDLHSSYLDCFEAHEDWAQIAFRNATEESHGSMPQFPEKQQLLYDRYLEATSKVEAMENKLMKKLK